jgi:sugar-specific transcriptional regulator TrmB
MASLNNLKNILSNLEIEGLQAEVYLALLELGEANYTEIAKKTDVKRTTLYAIIDKMEKRGLLKRGVNNKMAPMRPEQVFEKIQSNNLIFHQAFPLFRSIMKEPAKPTKVKFYNGHKGIQQLFMDDLEYYRGKKEKILRIVAGAAFYNIDSEFRDQYAIKRQETGIETRIIGSYDLKPFVGEYKKQFSMQEVKFLPERLGEITGRISASPDRISLIGFLKDESGIVISNKEMADTFIKFFDFTWGLLK